MVKVRALDCSACPVAITSYRTRDGGLVYTRLPTRVVREEYELDPAQFVDSWLLVASYDLYIWDMLGIKYEWLDGFTWDDQRPIFGGMIRDLYERRRVAKAAGEDAYQLALKVMMNSVYGRMTMRDVVTQDKVLPVTDGDEGPEVKIGPTAAEHELGELEYLPGQTQALVTFKAQAGETFSNRSPSHVACCILSRSRYIMYEALEAVARHLDISIQDASLEIYYMDTDSFYMSRRLAEGWAAAGYVHDQLGGFKNDCGGGRITKFFSPMPKAKMVTVLHNGVTHVECTLKGYNGTSEQCQAVMESLDQRWYAEATRTSWSRTLHSVSTVEVPYHAGEQNPVKPHIKLVNTPLGLRYDYQTEPYEATIEEWEGERQCFTCST